MTRELRPSQAPATRVRRFDPLGLWLCGLAVLGLARAWLYLVRDAGAADAVGWIWLAGSVCMAAVGLVLLARGLLRAGAAPDPPAAGDRGDRSGPG